MTKKKAPAKSPKKSPARSTPTEKPAKAPRKSKGEASVKKSLRRETRTDKVTQARREALAAAKIAIEAALEKKAVLPVLIDVCGQASYADYIGVVSGRSDRQVDAIAEHVCQVMNQHGHRAQNKEGMRAGRWVLLDFGDVVMHIFYEPLREVFDIESLWIDAPRVKLAIPA